ncbi:MAG: UDP-N-acetylmuramoyl-L-alanyl-D-glutamate--2,6-diaminopimelate ligase [Bacteroidetes bacterium]|nr:UDP-N-acetylmuramoyl-L-alanyl-D-glutamate--2,6-diaminopimelate ligase [Bacteroidota bacterium]
MKTLKSILENAFPYTVQGDENIGITGITIDSRQVKPGFLFIAIRGTVTDGHQYIKTAVDLGAVAVCCEDASGITEGTSTVITNDSAIAAGHIASAFHDHPSRKLTMVGVTGTNGKTTVATLLHSLFTNLGNKCGLLSTVENIIGDTRIAATHTTPDAINLNALLDKMVEEGCNYCFMEVSSHAIHQHRITGLSFQLGIFTNITHDHLDYHKTFENYIKAKKAFFDHLDRDAFALVNKDDRNGMVMIQNCKASCFTYALHSQADFQARIIEHDLRGMLLKIGGQEAWFQLVGKFNAYNLLAVYGSAFLLGVPEDEIITELSKLKPVSGRFEYLRNDNGVIALIDYAHTPDALLNVLETINAIRSKNETLFTVVGCGGNRDHEKRPVMANVACVGSDRVILTSDNPRNENPEAILADMMTGVKAQDFKKVLKITDREEAIKTAISMANPNDIILIAGKGHETYQEIKGVRHPFDDRKVFSELSKKMN